MRCQLCLCNSLNNGCRASYTITSCKYRWDIGLQCVWVCRNIAPLVGFKESPLGMGIYIIQKVDVGFLSNGG